MVNSIGRQRSWHLFLLMLVITITEQSTAQNNGLLQKNDLSDTYRLYQLTDTSRAVSEGFANHSFLIRPVKPVQRNDPKQFFSLENLSYALYYNDSLGTGYNNESFFQATGWQQRLSVGLKLKIDRFELNLQPELVTAQNQEQAAISSSFTADPNFFSRYYFMNINVIDLPSRFGTKSITKLFFGQSNIKYHFNKFSAGISSENIWWGPGMRNALVMTNQAPGFLHLSLQTEKPVQTKIGTFEGQVIYGFLDSSGVVPVENVRQATIWSGAYVPKISQSNRSIAAIAVAWQPKWVPHLYLGFAASYYFYPTTKDYFNNPFPEYPYSSSRQDQNGASLGSLFFRYAMPADKAEIYFEIGRGDKPATPFNLFKDTIPLAYIGGLRKLISLPKKGEFIELSAEVAHLQLPDPRLIFTAANPFSIPKTRSWYTNAKVRQGYTHYGQSLGAGIGPGSNSQTANISWVKGRDKVGLHVERVIHNEDFYLYQYISGNIGGGTANRHWVDLSYGIHGQFTLNKFQLAGSITSTSALNYQWVKVDGALNDGPSKDSDKRNLNVTLSMIYSIDRIFQFRQTPGRRNF